VADTTSNRPYARRLATIRYFRTGDITIPKAFHATWLVVDKTRFHVRVPWRLVYGDSRFALYHRTA
jgi:cytochrome b559 alpha subunit